MLKHIIKELDRLEDHVRHWLSKRPLLYALVAGVGVVLFWRGVWDLAGLIIGPWVSLLVSVVIMLITGTFVSFFIGDQIIISGMKAEKRVDEKTEEEIRKEESEIAHLDEDMELLKSQVADIKRMIEKADL
ncbi:MAG: hypothetical protein AAB483_00150 [Patescibacteria group bacterium]